MIIDCLNNTKNQQVDVVIITVPWTDSSIPLMAPAVLKPIVEKAGFSCLAVDLNAEVFAKTNGLTNFNDVVGFFFDEQCLSEQCQHFINDLIQSIARAVVSWQPRYVGLSLFSYVCRPAARWIIYFIKKIDPSIQIIVGGAGCLEQFTGPAYFAQELLDANLADYHIRGDGENSLYELLKGNDSYSGVNDISWQQIEQDELETLPVPDYDNYNFDLYIKQAIAIQGSRGCVRKCKFCDYIENWKKFQWRTADNIFEEMVQQYKKYNIRFFKFQDTLTNGNLKEFTRLIDLLCDYNEKNPNESFRWSGYYIFREQSANDDRAWSLLKKSGADVLVVGIENLNQEIRYDIGKKFSNESIDYHLAQALKNKVGLQLLFITGYVNETQDHIDFSKKWLKDHVEFQPIIHSIQWGGGLGIFPNTYLDRNKEQLGIKMIGPQPHMWVNEKINSTPEVRAKWVYELIDYSKKLGYNVSENLDNHFLLEQTINDKF